MYLYKQKSWALGTRNFKISSVNELILNKSKQFPGLVKNIKKKIGTAPLTAKL